MCLSIPLSEDAEAALRKQAKVAGVSPETLASRFLEHSIRRMDEYEAAMTPVREAFRASGLTEDEAVELFEAEKHAMRREGRDREEKGE